MKGSFKGNYRCYYISQTNSESTDVAWGLGRCCVDC